MAAVFLLMALAILALKMLSDLTEDRRRYEVLFRLGADEREQGRALFGQTFFFFLLPFCSAMVMSIPTCMIGMQTVDALHMDGMAGDRVCYGGSDVGAVSDVLWGGVSGGATGGDPVRHGRDLTVWDGIPVIKWDYESVQRKLSGAGDSARSPLCRYYFFNCRPSLKASPTLSVTL